MGWFFCVAREGKTPRNRERENQQGKGMVQREQDRSESVQKITNYPTGVSPSLKVWSRLDGKWGSFHGEKSVKLGSNTRMARNDSWHTHCLHQRGDLVTHSSPSSPDPLRSVHARHPPPNLASSIAKRPHSRH